VSARFTPPDLPIREALPALCEALRHHAAAVLEAPPGAGKSTVVPLVLLEEPWVAGRKILMLEPRRLAARAVATRLAHHLGEVPGQTVGYRMRLDHKVGRTTRIEVITEGILTRMIENDPALEDAAAVLFDEFHERSLAADLGLALCLDAKHTLRPDLRLLVMSATLDGAAVARLLGDAPRITSAGRSFPVEVRHAKRRPEHLEREVAATIRRALLESPGDALVFLPGAAEIRRVAETLASDPPTATEVLPLYGELPPEAQTRALEPLPGGRRKVVLATNIAETSLTIEGIRIVIDGGWSRRNRFDPGSGMSRLETLPVSLASAEQRRGRAGRLAPGICYRVYTEADERALARDTPPEIREADLASLALDLALWGTAETELAWLDPPPAAHLAQACDLLTSLDALDTNGRITPVGRAMAGLGVHPRIARMLLAAEGPEAAALAATLAALLSERDPVRGRSERDSSLEKRIELLRGAPVAGLEADRGALARIRRLAEMFEREIHRLPRHASIEPRIARSDVGLLLACAYPDRIAQRRGATARYLLANGRGAAFAGPDGLAQQSYLVIADLDGGEREARIHRAAALDADDFRQIFKTRIETEDRLEWDRRETIVRAVREERLGALVLSATPLKNAPAEATVAAMLEGVRDLGISALPWTPAALSLGTRIGFLRRVLPPAEANTWPNLDDEALMRDLPEWLGPFLDGFTRRDHLSRLDLVAILSARLSYEQTRALATLAPTHYTVPSGSRIPIDYALDPPRISVRLQEVFGLETTPRVAGGRVPLALELLSPARRPVQLTQDLESFWARGYAEVRRELKGRYPKHYWPDDPRVAEATARVRPR